MIFFGYFGGVLSFAPTAISFILRKGPKGLISEGLDTLFLYYSHAFYGVKLGRHGTSIDIFHFFVHTS